MSNIRDLSTKINSLKNMQKVMKAMNMIASIKLRKLNYLKKNLSLFASSVDEIGKQIKEDFYDDQSIYIKGYDHVKKIHIIMFTSDKGLCGSHNSSIQKSVDAFIRAKTKDGIEPEITCIGNKGVNFCKRNNFLIFQQTEINERIFTIEQLESMVNKIIERYNNQEIQQCYVFVNQFYSTLNHKATLQQLLPLDIPKMKIKGGTSGRMIIEPERDAFIVSATRLYLYYKLKSFLYHSYLCEHSARMTAMENATHNSKDLINKYITMQNHIRQTTITNELIEIVSGKEALKG